MSEAWSGPRRPLFWWGLALALLAVVGLCCWGVVVPVCQVRGVVRDRSWDTLRYSDQSRPFLGSWRQAFLQRIEDGSRNPQMPIDRLGGCRRAASKLGLYLRLPDWICPDKPRAVDLLGACDRPGAAELFRTLSAGRQEIRFSAVARLCWYGLQLPEHIPDMDRALADPDPKVRALTVVMLDRLHRRHDGAHDALLKALDDPDGGGVSLAALSFARRPIRARAAVPQLIRLLSSGTWTRSFDPCDIPLQRAERFHPGPVHPRAEVLEALERIESAQGDGIAGSPRVPSEQEMSEIAVPPGHGTSLHTRLPRPAGYPLDFLSPCNIV